MYRSEKQREKKMELDTSEEKNQLEEHNLFGVYFGTPAQHGARAFRGEWLVAAELSAQSAGYGAFRESGERQHGGVRGTSMAAG